MGTSSKKLLWLSDTPHRQSGFGIVSGEICSRLASLNHEITMLGWWSTRGADHYKGIPVRSVSESPYGAVPVISQFIDKLRPDFVIALGDVPWLSYLASEPIQKSLAQAASRLCFYFPIDGVLPDGRLPLKWTEVLSRVDVPITMSRFGLAAAALSGITATYIPHGCNTDLFAPPVDKALAKRRFGYDGKFVVLSDVRNHRRKLIPRMLDILRLLRISADRLVLHIHTNETPEEDADVYGYDLRADIAQLGLESAVTLTTTSAMRTLSTKQLAELYAASDVHLLASYGEGFGLPSLQAASSGVVPIACSNSANIELVGTHGFGIPSESSTIDEFGLVRSFINRQLAAQTLQRLYDDSSLLKARADESRLFALGFSWDRIAAQWDELLHRCPSRRWAPPNIATVETIAPRIEQRVKTERPTGHSSSILPTPRLGIPVRLEPTQTNLVLVAHHLIGQFCALERLFPGVQVVPLEPLKPAQLLSIVRRALLVIDLDGSLSNGVDLACAIGGTSFLGPSKYWSRVPARGVLMQARMLLTDMPYSQTRASIARWRAEASGTSLRHEIGYFQSVSENCQMPPRSVPPLAT